MVKQEQIEQWSKLYGRQITETEYDEMCSNLSGFFGLLKEWDANCDKTPAVPKLP